MNNFYPWYADCRILGHVVPSLGAVYGDSYAARGGGVQALLHSHAYSPDEVCDSVCVHVCVYICVWVCV